MCLKIQFVFVFFLSFSLWNILFWFFHRIFLISSLIFWWNFHLILCVSFFFDVINTLSTEIFGNSIFFYECSINFGFLLVFASSFPCQNLLQRVLKEKLPFIINNTTIKNDLLNFLSRKTSLNHLNNRLREGKIKRKDGNESRVMMKNSVCGGK